MIIFLCSFPRKLFLAVKFSKHDAKNVEARIESTSRISGVTASTSKAVRQRLSNEEYREDLVVIYRQGPDQIQVGASTQILQSFPSHHAERFSDFFWGVPPACGPLLQLQLLPRQGRGTP